MSKVINFPDRTSEEKKNSPEGCLEEVLEAIKSGKTSADSIVIAWNEPGDDDIYRLRYMIGGTFNVAHTVGLLEMTKIDILE